MKKVFIVDDSQLYIDMLSGMLNADDLMIFTTTDATEAMGKIKACMPDLIVIDMVMPKLGGLDLLNMLSMDNEVNHIPRILMSAEDLSEIKYAYSTFDDYICKSDEAREIRKSVNAWSSIGLTRNVVRALTWKV